MKYEIPRFQYLKTDLIDPDPNQPRKDFGSVNALGEDMVTNGQVQPIIVKPVGDRYRIVDGERRWRGAETRGEEFILCQIVEVHEAEIRSIQFRSNFFRRDFNPFELCTEFERLLDEKWMWTHDDLAKYLGMSRPAISDTLSLSKIPSDIRTRLLPAARSIPKDSLYRIGHAETREKMEHLAELALSGASTKAIRDAAKGNGISTEQQADRGLAEKASNRPEPEVQSAPARLEDRKPHTDGPKDNPEANECPAPANVQDGTVQNAEPLMDMKQVADKEHTVDEQIVLAWWEAYSVHAVRLLDLKTLDLPLSGKAFDTWLKTAIGTQIFDYRVVKVTAAIRKYVYQLVPVNLYKKLELSNVEDD